MKTVSVESSAPDEGKPRRQESWPLSRWLLLIVFVLAAHVALIFAFGARKPVTPVKVKNVPELQLADGSSEWLLLNNPTLFALPNIQGFAGPAWLEPPHAPFHPLEWTEPPRWWQLSAAELGNVFSRFMETNRFAGFKFDLKPSPQFTVPLVPLEPGFAGVSTLRIEGDIARRPLLTSFKLPWATNADVVAPSIVQVLVNAAGNVVSAVVLPSRNSGEVRDAGADRRALELARTARFAGGPDLTLGKLIFNWRTVPPPATNALPAL
jgi:hypothetical protein